MFQPLIDAGFEVRKSNSMGSQAIHQVFRTGQIQPLATILIQGKKKKFIKSITVGEERHRAANINTLLNMLGAN